MQKIKWKNSAALLLAAFVWGVAFVAQSVGMDYVEPVYIQWHSLPDRKSGIIAMHFLF